MDAVPLGQGGRPAVARPPPGSQPDLALLDLQIGTMGGDGDLPWTSASRSRGGRLPHVPVIMLLDRLADVFLAQRSGAEGWLIKPLDSLRLRKATRVVLGGGTYTEGVPADQPTSEAHRPPARLVRLLADSRGVAQLG